MHLNRRLFCASALALAGCSREAAPILRTHPLGIQLYALGPTAYTDLDATLAALAEIGYREVEISEGAKPAAEMRAALSRAGLTCPSVHLAGGFSVQTPATMADAAIHSIEYAQAVGATYAGPSMFPFIRERSFDAADPGDIITGMARSYSRDDWRRICDMFNETAARFKAAGLNYFYHNHNIEFAPLEAGTIMDVLIAHTDPALVGLEVDVGWVKAAGQDPAGFIRQHASRIKLLHLKDLTAETQPNTALAMAPTAVGQGVQDWADILRAAEAAGVAHYFVEQEPPFMRPHLESARMSFEHLQSVS